MELRTLHYIHHLGDMKSNFAMINLGMDGIFGSLMIVDPLRKSKNNILKKLINNKGSDQNKLPDKIDDRLIGNIKESAGFSAFTLGFDIDLEIKSRKRSNALKRG